MELGGMDNSIAPAVIDGAGLPDSFDELPVMVFSIGPDGLVRAHNLRAREALEYSEDELNGKPVLELDHPVSLGKTKALFARFLEDVPIRNEDLVMMRKDGTPVPIKLTAKQVRDTNGELVGSRSVAAETSERFMGEVGPGASTMRVSKGHPALSSRTRITGGQKALGEGRPNGQNAATKLETLTMREMDVIAALASGATNTEIGTKLSISEGTVRHHLSNALGKLGLRNRAEAAAFAVRAGITD